MMAKNLTAVRHITFRALSGSICFIILAGLVAGSASAQAAGKVQLIAAAPAEGHNGVWKIVPTTKGLLLDITFNYPSSGSFDHTQVPITPAKLGISQASLNVPSTPVSFEIRNQGGDFRYSGVVNKGQGSGVVAFDPDATFDKSISELGLGVPTDRQRVNLALFDVTTAYVQGIVHVFPAINLDNVIVCRVFGIDPQTAAAIRENVPDLTMDGLLTLIRVHATAEYVAALKASGVRDMTWRGVAAAKTLDVSEAYADELRAVGYGNLPIDDLRKLKAAGIDAAFIRKLSAQGAQKLSVDELVQRKASSAGP